jgi:uncharacterized protein
MRVTGAVMVSQPPSAVWSALNDPAVLARAIPGCERLDVTGEGACTLTVVAAIAAVAGRYEGEVQIAERAAPGLIRANVSGSGNRGEVGADVIVRLEPSGDAATQVSYEADLRAHGPLAAVGQRVLASITKRLAVQFLAGIESELSAPAPPRVVAAGDATVVIERVRQPVATGGEPEPVRERRTLIESAEPPTIDLQRVQADQAATASAQPSAEDRPAPMRSLRSAIAGAGAGGRAGLLTGATAALAGIAIGVLVGRRARPGRR